MKCVVLLSGGVDSTTCLAMALTKYKKDDVSANFAAFSSAFSSASTFALASPIFGLHDVKVIAKKLMLQVQAFFFQIFHFKSSNDLLFLHLSIL